MVLRSDKVSLPAAGGGQGGEVIGDLALHENDSGLVLFVHGSGSSRHSTRNRWVARQLGEAGLSTLLMDLLTPEEERVDSRTGELRFDIPLLTSRVLGVLDWLAEHPATRSRAIGMFGASTGAAAALGAAVHRPDLTHAIVSRGGRPDLAPEPLDAVRAPTLLIVGGLDPDVLDLNRAAAKRLRVRCKIRVVEGATHLFEERGALEQVSGAAVDWFRTLAAP